jgi:hypothetical protein
MDYKCYRILEREMQMRTIGRRKSNWGERRWDWVLLILVVIFTGDIKIY